MKIENKLVYRQPNIVFKIFHGKTKCGDTYCYTHLLTFLNEEAMENIQLFWVILS